MVIASLAEDRISGEEFLELITSGDRAEVNRVSKKVIERMTFYLMSAKGADPETAKDCAHQAFENVYSKVLNEALEDVQDIYGYLINSAKNEYLMVLRNDKVEVPDEFSYFSRVVGKTDEDVIDAIYSKEKERLLKYCIEQMKNKKRRFFLSVLKLINEHDRDAAKKLNMSYGNFRTRKSRVIDSLRECVKRAAGTE